MKVTTEEISKYLPYSIKFYDSRDDRIATMTGLFDNQIQIKNKRRLCNMDIDEIGKNSDVKPLLRPMSDLVVENKEGFVPIVELFELRSQATSDWENYYIEDNTAILKLKDKNYAGVIEQSYFEVDLEPYDVSFSIASEIEKDGKKETRFYLAGNEMKMYEKLFEWHFDVFGLIDKGLAISKNEFVEKQLNELYGQYVVHSKLDYEENVTDGRLAKWMFKLGYLNLVPDESGRHKCKDAKYLCLVSVTDGWVQPGYFEKYGEDEYEYVPFDSKKQLVEYLDRKGFRFATEREVFRVLGSTNKLYKRHGTK